MAITTETDTKRVGCLNFRDNGRYAGHARWWKRGGSRDRYEITAYLEGETHAETVAKLRELADMLEGKSNV